MNKNRLQKWQYFFQPSKLLPVQRHEWLVKNGRNGWPPLLRPTVCVTQQSSILRPWQIPVPLLLARPLTSQLNFCCNKFRENQMHQNSTLLLWIVGRHHWMSPLVSSSFHPVESSEALNVILLPRGVWTIQDIPQMEPEPTKTNEALRRH